MKKKILSLALAMLMCLTLAPSNLAHAIPVPENSELARNILSEGTVLLKNEDEVLPLVTEDKVAVFGQGQVYTGSTSNGYQVGGGGSGMITPAYTPVSPIDAIIEAGVNIYTPLAEEYKKNVAYIPTEEMYDNASKYANKAIMFISRFSCEGSDRSTGKGDWLLSDAEETMIKNLSKKFNHVIVLCNVGGVIDTSWAAEKVDGINVDALLMVWHGGAEGGNGIADVITGKTNPSGKLVDTFAKNIDDYPTTEGFYNNAFVDYKEDIFVGYRYFETFNKPVNYEFGFGLSYTTFETKITGYRSDENNIYVDTEVKNTGKVSGKEVVQVYYEAPQMGTGKALLSKSSKELAAFQKTKELKPGETQKITLSYPIDDMATFDDTGLTGHKSAYVMEAGDYKVYAGTSVKKIEIAGTYTQDKFKVTEQLSQLVAPNMLKERLLANNTYEGLIEFKKVSSDGTTRIEGENYINAYGKDNGYVRVEDFDNETGKGKCVAYVDTEGGFVEYGVEVEKAGLYDLGVRYANGYANKYNCVNVYINETKQPNANIDFLSTAHGSETELKYHWFEDAEPTIISLEEGVNRIKIESKSGFFPNVDYFTLTSHKEVVIRSDKPSTIQAEYFDDSVSLNDVTVTREFFTNGKLLVNDSLENPQWKEFQGGCLAYMHQAGNSASYNINVEESGDYNISFCMSNGRTKMKNVLTFKVNDEKQDIIIDCVQTGDGAKGEWYNFVEFKKIGIIHLEKGKSVITLQSNGTSFPNIDSMTLSNVKLDEKSNIGENETAIVQAENFSKCTGKTEIQNYGDNKACIAYLDVEGSTATYDLNVEEEGKYDMYFSMANGYEKKKLTVDMIVDGNTQSFSFDCEQTGDGPKSNEWYNFKEFYAGKIELPQGEISLTLSPNLTGFTSGGFANVDYIKFVKPGTTSKIKATTSTLLKESNAKEEGQKLIQLKDVVEGRNTYKELVEQMTIEELASFATGHAATVGSGTGTIGGGDQIDSKYGIPRADTADGPGGLRLSSKSTGWGCQMLVGCTWNLELAEQWGVAVGKEAIKSHVDIWLAPGMNIHRNPMCGRNFEYYSEDPLLTGKMSAAESKGVASQGVAVTIKHFITNNKEGNRNSSDSRVTERAMRQIYLKGFKIAIKEGTVHCIMTSYNFVNGTETSENMDLLTGIVRNEWGFDGLIMTDWGNNSNIVKEVLAGNNVKMPSGDANQLVEACKNGKITREKLEENAIYIIKVLAQLPDYTGLTPQPVTINVSATNTTKVEAETYADKFDKVQTEYGEVINVAYMDQKDANENYASYVTYNLDVEQQGIYDLMFRYANNETGTDILELSLDNNVYGDIKWDSPSTGGWQIYKDSEVGSIELPEGKHVLKIKSRGKFGNLDYFVLTPYRSELNEAIKNAEARVEADYTPETWEPFEKALDEAKKVFADKNATQEEVNNAEKQLKDAMAGLQKASQEGQITPPEIIKGAEQVVKQGAPAEFTSNAEYDDFIKVTVDNKVVSPKSYTVKEGSTIVTLSGDFTKGLSLGKHSFAIESENGKAETTFTIVKDATGASTDEEKPETGDNSNIALLLTIMMVCMGVVLVIIKRRKKANI